MSIINCTPHPITIRWSDESRTFSTSGLVPRVQMIEAEASPVDGIPTITQRGSVVTGLPDSQPDTFFIVSRMVWDACPNRYDLLVPDTGRGAIRDKDGRILAVRRFVRRER